MSHTSRKTILSILGALTLWLLPGCGPEPASRGRVVLIGLDGASWNLLDPMVKAGELPHFKSLMDRGVSAGLASVPPFLSPAVWTSIATSRRPEHHGVFYFYSNRHAIKVPTIWDRLAAGGLRVGLYDYLVTWPPRRFPHGGFSVPGWLRRDESVWPPDLFQRIGLPRYAYAVVNVGGPEDIIANSERELRDKPRYWNRLWNELRPDVGAVTFYALDVVSHRFWHTLAKGGSPGPGASGSDILPRTARGIDRAIGEIVDNLAPEDTVLVVSDHGFQAAREARRRWGFDTRRLLQRAGIEPGREKLTVLSGFGSVFIRIEQGPAAAREATLERVAGFLETIRSSDGAAAFRILSRHVPPRPGELAAEQVRITPDLLPAHAFLIAQPDEEVFERIAREGSLWIGGERIPMDELATAHDFTGAHSRIGIFLAAGPAIRHHSRRLRLSALDVAPLMMYLAGQPVPGDMEGRLQRALIDPDHLERDPPDTIEAAKAPRLPDEKGGAAGAREDAETSEKLRALGYIQ
ncbi:MAG TPA: alkaline phosphatase family protein [Thermoanaerobaculia bacterium]